jgi:hypothetical protein
MNTSYDPYKLIKAALSWWKWKRPVEWSVAEHLKNPTINTVTDREAKLARECAKVVQLDAYKKRKEKKSG